jgi:N-acetyl-gamma-glutamylphosphate reductase
LPGGPPLNRAAFVGVNEARRQALLIGKFDSLGKGASGAAAQSLLLMLRR